MGYINVSKQRFAFTRVNQITNNATSWFIDWEALGCNKVFDSITFLLFYILKRNTTV